MSKGSSFVLGAVVGTVLGTIGGVTVVAKSIVHSIEKNGVTYILNESSTGNVEKWIVSFGSKPSTSRFGFVYKKEETESNETECNETSEDNRQGSTPE